MNQMKVKPAREMRVGDMLWVLTEGGEFEIEVLALSDVRGPASVAQGLYRETDASKERRAQEAEARKMMQAIMPTPERRPSKRDRRLIHRFREDRG